MLCSFGISTEASAPTVLSVTPHTHTHTHTQYGKEGDGYERKSPHTENEKFEGLHLLEAAKVRGHYHFVHYIMYCAVLTHY